MNTKSNRRTTLALAALIATPAFFFAGCDKTESKTKTESTKVVNTPEGQKKVTESTESKTTVDKK